MTGRDIKLQLDELERTGHLKARTVVARLLEMDDRDRLLLRVRVEAAHGAELRRIRGLWTAWCLTVGAVPGTPEYENALDGVQQDFQGPFDRSYMGKYVNEAYGLKP